MRSFSMSMAVAVVAAVPAIAAAPPSPGGPVSCYFRGVSASSSTDVWAVGTKEADAGAKTFTHHWDGSAWTTVASPNPGGTWGSYFDGVQARSATDAWAVGYYFTAPMTEKTLVAHWDGRHWTQVPSPSPGGDQRSELDAVTAVSSTDAWAVGYFFTGTAFRTLVEHWDGSTWSQVPSPGRPGNDGIYLFDVSATSVHDVWAVGNSFTGDRSSTLVLHEDGTGWTRVPGPSPGGPPGSFLAGVDAVSPSDAWSVGAYYPGTSETPLTLVEHWNGTVWTRVASPSPGGTDARLSAVSAGSARDVWAVGAFHRGRGPAKNVYLHFDGAVWSSAPAAKGARTGFLAGVVAVSRGDAWAVGIGASSTTADPPVEHWDGTEWSHP